MEKTTVLLINDEARIRQTVARTLRQSGCTVITAENGKAGLALFDQEQPDITLVNLQMPGLDGLTVLREMRTREPEADVILISGHDDQEAVIAALRAGASDFLPKPIDSVALKNALHRAEERLALKRKLRSSQQALRQQNVRLAEEVRARTEDLHKSEALFRGLTDNSFDIMNILAADATILYESYATKRILGYEAGGRVGQSAMEFVHPEEQEAIQKRFQQLVATPGGTELIELRFRHEDGSWRWLEACGQNFLHDPDLKGILINSRDITERKRAEQAILTERERLDTILSTLDTGLSLTAPDMTISWANQKIYDMFPGKDPLGQMCHAFYESRDTPCENCGTLAAFQTGKPQVRERYNPSDGHWYMITSGPVKDKSGHVINVLEGITDITARKQAEETLRESESRYHSLFGNNHAPMLLIDPDTGAIVDANPSACAYYGYTKDELTARTISEINTLSQAEVFEEMARARNQSRRHFLFRHRLASGEIRDVEAYSGPIWVQGRQLLYSIIHDITTRKQAEEALRQSKERYRTLVESAEEAIATVDENGVFLFMNGTAAQRLGGKPEDFIDQTMHDLFPPEMANRQLADIQQVIRTGKGKIIETTTLLQGIERRYRTSIQPLRASQGNVNAALLIARDTTVRKQAEEALRKSEARAQALVEAIPDMMFRLDRDGVYLDYKAARSDLYVQDEEVIIGKRNRDLAPPEFVDLLDTFIARTLATGEMQVFEYQLPPSGRGLRDYEARMVPSGSDEVTVIVRDITARKQREEALRTRLRYEKNVAHLSQVLLEDSETEDAIAKALDHLLDASEAARVYIFQNFVDNREGLCMRQTHESSAPDVDAQMDNPTLQYIPYAEGFERWANTLAQGKPIRGTVSTFPPEERAVLEPQDIHAILVLPINVDRRWQGFIGFDETRFVREWRDEDVRLLQTAAEIIGNYLGRKQMEEKIENYAAELERSNHDLEHFGYVVSHDLQAPLRTVKSFLALLQQRYTGELDEQANEYIEFAVDGAQQMTQLIKALLHYARVDSRGREPEPTDAEKILEQTLQILQFKIEQVGVEVTQAPLPTVLADPVQLGQLFQNLIENALKFHDEEALRVHIEAVPHSDPAQKEKDALWRFSVRDNGIGIAPQHQERIFEIFRRLHTREEYEGTGIGLATCKKIVERHGGRIWVESEEGEGATFYFTLPGA